MPITGKVAAIINDREVIINRGTETGVEEGAKFKITGPELTVTDPDTGDILGDFSREKIRVKIAEVFLKYSVARTYETYVINVPGPWSNYGPATLAIIGGIVGRQQVTRVKTLRSDVTTQVQPFEEETSIVKVGDPVVEIEDDN